MRHLALAFCMLVSSTAEAQVALSPEAGTPLTFSGTGHTVYGDWRADVSVSEARWRPGLPLAIDVALRFSDAHLAGMTAAGIKADKLCVLVTAERTFDADGWLRLPSDERMSTLLTPTGLAIEGGVQGAASTRFGYQFRAPFDELSTVAVSQAASSNGARTASFSLGGLLPNDLPPGLYRLRVDLGVMVGTRYYNFNGFSFAQRPSSDQAGTSTYFYSPVIPASAPDVSGRAVNALAIRARIPWLLLSNYNSNGYRGVIADEDRHRFATSDRSLIPDDVVLPMYDDAGARVSYSLEPQFPADTIDPLQNMPWTWTSGELTVRITAPDGTATDLGTAPFQARSGNGPTTKKTAFTAWKPAMYGRYTVTATGWISDGTGRRYEGGGTYRFWIAKRMTLATATFQGMSYPVGSTYGRDIQFNPPFPADVEVTATLYVNSRATDSRTLTYSGKASPSGIFGAAQGMKAFPLTAPGEYHAQILAKYTDAEGHLWVSVMRHAGIVYVENGPVIARGKKLYIGGKYVDRGETAFEGYVEPDGTQHLAHITFPYEPGDVLLIGAEGQGANKIEPVLTYQMRGDTSPWDTKLNGVGTTNLRVTTSNGYSPHLYPEYITNLEYYYAAAPRPGFMGRFIVGESTVRAPYWPVSPNSFGNQIGASANGDAPGDIYRLIGGVVLRRVGQDPMYSGYISSAFMLAKGTNNNRVVAGGTEDLNGPLGKKARFFLVGLRPGSAFEVGSTFRPALQIDPILPVAIKFVLTYPDGRTQTSAGTGDRFGSFAGSTAWPLDVAGVYRYRVTGSWNGYQGGMPGLANDEGQFYVYSPSRPSGATGLRLDGATTRTFSASGSLTITGTSSASSVSYAVITPGAVIDQGEIPVSGGKFQYVFNPATAHARVPLYDIVSITTGKPQIGRVVHLTFFSQERGSAGAYYDFARVILRGTTALLPRTGIPTAAAGATGEAAPSATAPAASALRVASSDPREIRTWDETIARMTRDGELRLVRREADALVDGVLHERLQQYYRGVPVYGAELARQVRRGVTVSLFGALREGIVLDANPALDAGEAATLIERAVSGVVDGPRRPSLVVLPIEAGGYALAWIADVRIGTQRERVFLDATSGEVLARIVERADAEISALASGDGRSAVATVAAFYARVLRRSLDGDPRLLTSAVTADTASHIMSHALAGDGEAAEAFAGVMSLAIVGSGLTTDERERTARIFYRAFAYMLPTGATLDDAVAATRQSAADLFGDDETAQRLVARAWAVHRLR